MPRTIDGLSLGTVAVVVAVLIALDIIGTLVLAGAVGAGGRSKAASSRWDWDLAGSAARVYNRYDHAVSHAACYSLPSASLAYSCP